VVRVTARVGRRVADVLSVPVAAVMNRSYAVVHRLHGPEGVFARTWTTGAIAFWAVLILGVSMLMYFFGG
jgi:hypothetical protein